jgi:hypothetical protein
MFNLTAAEHWLTRASRTLCLFGLFLLLARPARPQGTPPGETPAGEHDDRPGASVSISLDDAFIATRLPFDVPFFLTGTAETGTSEIVLTTYEVRTKGAMSPVVEAFRKAGSCAARTAPPEAREVGSSSWQSAAQVVPPAPSAPQTMFKILVDALEPQRYYVFCFDLRGPVPSSEIAPEARRVVAEVVTALLSGDVTDVDTISLTMAQNVRDRLSSRIQEIGTARPVPAVIPEDNLFSPNRRVTKGDTFVELLTELVEPYQQAAGRVKEYADRYGALEKVMQDLGDAKEFLSAEVLAALPTAKGAKLPSVSAALSEGAPFDFATFNFSELVESLDEAQHAAHDAGKPEAEKTLHTIENHVRALQRLAAAFGRVYENVRNAVGKVIAHIELETRQIRVSLGSSVLSADLNRNVYVSLDAGLAYPWDLETLAFYAGTNIYFRPVNKNAPLRAKGSFSRRFALTVGVTTTIEDASRRASDLRASKNSLLLGAGLRLTPSLRFGGGVLVFKESSINPLVTQTSVAVTPYVSLAFDVNVAAALGAMFPQ